MTFSATEAQRMAGVSYRQIDYWARTHLVSPSIMDANGSGTQRRYSADDIRALRVIVKLVTTGVSLQSLRGVQRLLADLEPGSHGYLVVIGDEASHAKDIFAVADLIERGDAARVVALIEESA